MNINCLGPCLQHCYYKNNIIIFFLGILFGIIISDIKFIQNRKFKNKNLIII